MADERPKKLFQNIAALLTLIVVLALILLSALGDALFKHHFSFPPVAYGLMTASLYFIFGFRMEMLKTLLLNLIENATTSASQRIVDEAKKRLDNAAAVPKTEEKPKTETPKKEGA